MHSELNVSLGCIVRPCLKTTITITKREEVGRGVKERRFVYFLVLEVSFS
jgi:hypothetical protein